MHFQRASRLTAALEQWQPIVDFLTAHPHLIVLSPGESVPVRLLAFLKELEKSERAWNPKRQ
jgi:hypothetical protein